MSGSRTRALRKALGPSKAVRRWWNAIPHTHRHMPITKLLGLFPLYRRFDSGWQRVEVPT